MATTVINVEVDPDVAAIYKGAPAEDRSKLCTLWAVLLRDYRSCPIPLRQLMDEIGAKARASGLTPQLLESILHAG